MILVMCPVSPPDPKVRALVSSCQFQLGIPQPEQPAYFPGNAKGLFEAGQLRMDASREFRGAILIGSTRSRRRTRAESYGEILDVLGTSFVSPKETPDLQVFEPLTAAGLEEARRRYLALRPFDVENALSVFRHAILNWLSWINTERRSSLSADVIAGALVERIALLPSKLNTHLRQVELHLRLAVTPALVEYRAIEESAARVSRACFDYIDQAPSTGTITGIAAVVAALDRLREVIAQRSSMGG